MITVFGAPPTRAMRVIWACEELGLPYEIRRVDFAQRMSDAEFIAASPTGSMPALRDGDVVMCESAAIVEYLGARYGSGPLAPKLGDAAYPAYLQFLHFGEASLTAPMNVTFGSRFFAPDEEKDNFGARLAVDIAISKSAALASRLEKAPYVCGADFTLADISVAYPLGLVEHLGAGDRLDPVMKSYLDRVRARPAFQRAVAHTAPM